MDCVAEFVSHCQKHLFISGFALSFLSFRAQSHNCGPGQCWQDHHPLSVVSGEILYISAAL